MKNRWTLLSSGIKNFVYNNIKLSITSSSSSEKICHIKPKSSIVLETYLKQRNYPTWTAFYVAQSDIQNDLWGQSHFNFSIIQEHHSDEKVNNKQLISRKNYHVLRTGAFPFVKFHCTLRPKEDLTLENIFYNGSVIRNGSRANVIEIGISYLNNVSSRDISYCGTIVFNSNVQIG